MVGVLRSTILVVVVVVGPMRSHALPRGGRDGVRRRLRGRLDVQFERQLRGERRCDRQACKGVGEIPTGAMPTQGQQQVAIGRAQV